MRAHLHLTAAIGFVAMCASSRSTGAEEGGEKAERAEAVSEAVTGAAPAGTGTARPAPVLTPRSPSWDGARRTATTTEIDSLTVTCGVEVRLSAEMKRDYDFDDSVDTRGKDDGYFTSTSRVFLGLKFNDRFNAVLCGQDVHRWDKESTQPNDEFDLYLGYFDLRMRDLPVGLRVGRQELDYGKGRLLARSWGSPYGKAFDAAMLSYESERWAVHAFAGNKVDRYYDSLNLADHNEDLHGVYGMWRANKAHKLDAYFLSKTNHRDLVTGEDGRDGDVAIYTVGVRAHGKLGDRLKYDVEVPFQFGDYAYDDVNAWALAARAEYAFDGPSKPFVVLEYDQASGDGDGTDGDREHFDDLYGTNWSRLGVSNLLNWENVRHVGLGAGARPAKGLKLALAYHFFWLDEAGDWWRDYIGIPIRRDFTGTADNEVGQEIDLKVSWRPKSDLALLVGWGHFFPGQFVEDTGAHDDSDYLYFMVVKAF